MIGRSVKLGARLNGGSASDRPRKPSRQLARNNSLLTFVTPPSIHRQQSHSLEISELEVHRFLFQGAASFGHCPARLLIAVVVAGDRGVHAFVTITFCRLGIGPVSDTWAINRAPAELVGQSV